MAVKEGDRDAIGQRCLEIDRYVTARLLEFDRVRAIWGSHDLGFRSGTLISPRDLRALVMPGHRVFARMAHEAGRLYFLHSCGNLSLIMDDSTRTCQHGKFMPSLLLIAACGALSLA